MSDRLIYGLVDPRDSLVRYVGKSETGMGRPRSHLRDIYQETHKSRWIRQLISAGLEYEIVTLSREIDSSEELCAEEVRAIAVCRFFNERAGKHLTNATDGGEGTLGYKHLPDSKHFVRLTNLNEKQWKDPEFRAMQSAKMTETSAKQWKDPEFRAMQSAKAKELNEKQWKDPEFRAMHSAKTKELNVKLWKDPEFRAMKSAKTKEQWKDPEFKAKALANLKQYKNHTKETK